MAVNATRSSKALFEEPSLITTGRVKSQILTPSKEALLLVSLHFTLNLLLLLINYCLLTSLLLTVFRAPDVE